MLMQANQAQTQAQEQANSTGSQAKARRRVRQICSKQYHDLTQNL